MKIVADQNIPQIAEAFHDLGEVHLLPGREIKRRHLRDCRCLIVRTATRVDADLLRDTAVEFVATATIGTDHIDLDYIEKSGLGFCNSAGCNAEAVSEYVISGLFAISKRKGLDPFAANAGIVGFGNVGSRLFHKFEALGIGCLICDPPLAASGDSARAFVDLDTILNTCDIISLHVPLTATGDHPTFHLLDAKRLNLLAEGCLLINTARGEVIDNSALLELLNARDDLRVFLDTWENEPLVARALLQRVDLATPHIAGYSIEGRLRATQMVLDAAAEHFKLTSGWQLSQQLPPDRKLNLEPANSRLQFWQQLFQAHCDIWRDHDEFVAGSQLEDAALAKHFDKLRKLFPDRLEYGRWIVKPDLDETPQLRQLGFQIGDIQQSSRGISRLL